MTTETDIETARLDALCAFLGGDDYSPAEVEVEVEDIEPTRYDETLFEAFGNEYRVLTDAEADDAVVEYVRESLWAFNASFLASYMPDGIDAEEIESIRGDRCEDANEAMLALVVAGGHELDELAGDAASADGRGHYLAGYDHEENEIKHAGRTWYVYRVN